ncbi:MAG: pyridoxal-phosphate dependent enzyme, partial [Verrucomicrobiae bacterium]|nr:pyridoxal-phosphate dependent enzyme [Verrucomicrobiae bacterium]
MNATIPTPEDLRAARQRLAGVAHRTPVLTCSSLDRLTGARLFFKCENLQRTGSFKFRGAWNAVQSLGPAEAARGVLTHSSGNHAAALACAAALRGIPAHIVMPRDTAAVKVRAVEHYGGRIIFCEPTLADRMATAERVQRETGAVLVHPYDDVRVIAGQATVGWELLEQQPELHAVIAPVSGGGLLSGIALAVAAARRPCAVFGAEPEAVSDAAESLRTGRLQPATGGQTCADGLRAALSERTFAILRRHARDILCVAEAELVAAMRLIWE